MIRFSGDFFYLNLAHNIHYVIFLLFKKRLDNHDTLVYTYSVVNREVIRNVVDIVKSEKGRVGLLI